MVAIFLLGVMAAAIGFGVFANSRWAGEHGWTYNKHNPRPPGSGYAPGAFEEAFQPSIEHVIEEQTSEEIRADQDEAGDKPQ